VCVCAGSRGPVVDLTFSQNGESSCLYTLRRCCWNVSPQHHGAYSNHLLVESTATSKNSRELMLIHSRKIASDTD
jgi:hypothetical protein